MSGSKEGLKETAKKKTMKSLKDIVEGEKDIDEVICEASNNTKDEVVKSSVRFVSYKAVDKLGLDKANIVARTADVLIEVITEDKDIDEVVEEVACEKGKS
jgi:hypothetical protein